LAGRLAAHAGDDELRFAASYGALDLGRADL
jgi:hypothetical protein